MHFQENTCNGILFGKIAGQSFPKIGLQCRCFQLRFAKSSYQSFHKTPAAICSYGKTKLNLMNSVSEKPQKRIQDPVKHLRWNICQANSR